jgi:glycosyltransferase involved in cell wall biosynthesis
VRILLVTANYHPSVGGIERYVELLANGLAERKHEVTVLCCRHEDAPLTELLGGVRIVRLPATDVLKRRWNLHYPLPAPWALTRQLRGLVTWADVVHVQDALYTTSAAALVAARAHRTPSVLTQHVSFTPQASRLLDSIERGVIRTVGRCSRLASRVVAPNAAVAAWAEGAWGIREVTVLAPGAREPSAEGTDRAALRRAFDLPEDRFVALFVGRDVPTKRLDLFLSAADPEYELVAVSDRPPFQRPGVRLMPFMAHEKLERLLLAVDAFVLPSQAEGLPVSLQEALLAGLPCLVTRVPGFDRYLRDDEVVWLEPSPASIRSALLALASDPQARADLGTRARAAGQREFGFDRFVDAHEALYSDLPTASPS